MSASLRTHRAGVAVAFPWKGPLAGPQARLPVWCHKGPARHGLRSLKFCSLALRRKSCADPHFRGMKNLINGHLEVKEQFSVCRTTNFGWVWGNADWLCRDKPVHGATRSSGSSRHSVGEVQAPPGLSAP